jgi:hypothetical protein
MEENININLPDDDDDSFNGDYNDLNNLIPCEICQSMIVFEEYQTHINQCIPISNNNFNLFRQRRNIYSNRSIPFINLTFDLNENNGLIDENETQEQEEENIEQPHENNNEIINDIDEVNNITNQEEDNVITNQEEDNVITNQEEDNIEESDFDDDDYNTNIDSNVEIDNDYHSDLIRENVNQIRTLLTSNENIELIRNYIHSPNPLAINTQLQLIFNELNVNNLNPDLNNITNVLSSFFDINLPEIRKVKTSDVEIPLTKDIKHDDDCPICLENLNNLGDDNKVTQIECNHIFCFKCINKWFIKKSQCPICKKNYCPEVEYNDDYNFSIDDDEPPPLVEDYSSDTE